MNKSTGIGALIAAASVPIALKLSRDGLTLPPMHWWEWPCLVAVPLFIWWCSRESRSRTHSGEVGDAPAGQNTTERLAFRLGQAFHRVLKLGSHLAPVRNHTR